jgi:serine/threonine protein kinase
MEPGSASSAGRASITAPHVNGSTRVLGESERPGSTVVEAFLVKRAGGNPAGKPPRDDHANSDGELLPPMLMPSPGLVIGGKYRLKAPIGRGGMGMVWVARHLDLDVLVAIKLMAPEYSPSSRERARFMREARAAARLRSRNVVTVLDYGVEKQTQYIVMELLEGEDLRGRLDRERILSPHEAAKLLDSIANAVELAHKAGIIHRDLKPENIFLARVVGETEEVVKVLDFGIAKDLNPGSGDESTRSGVAIGTPQYMSPEQARGSKLIDHRSDLWSIGVILFRALLGRLPFEGMVAIEILDALANDPIPVPSSIEPSLPADVDRFFARALAREPKERFQTIREMTEAFHRLVPSLALHAQRSTAQDDVLELSTGDFIAVETTQLGAWAHGRVAQQGSPAPDGLEKKSELTGARPPSSLRARRTRAL